MAGGDRIQKNNIEVARAVEILSARINKKIELRIYGRRYSDSKIFEAYPHSTYIGMLEQEEFFHELEKTNVFVLNSEVESFGLSAIDALYCGCNILVSKNSGIRSILSTTELDIISDVHNPNEIANKIERLIEIENNKRLISTLNIELCSWEKVSERLYQICCAVYRNEDYANIR